MLKVALFGTGLLGSAIAERILSFKIPLIVYNRTVSKTKNLTVKGAKIATTTANAIDEAQVILLVLSDAKTIEDLILNDPKASFAKKTFIQMGTIAPAESIQLQKEFHKKGADYFECPVLGSKGEALKGELILMVGSTVEQFNKWQDLFKCLSSCVYHIGETGQAALLKLALNHLIACHAISFSLSLGLVQKANVKVDDFMSILRGSFLYAPMFDRKLGMWLKREYKNPNFPAKHLQKDINLVLKEAKKYGLMTNVLEEMKAVADKTVQHSADLDYSSVFNTINNV
jgi:3-hydroxyisobutyrate dehydrogenase